MSETICVIDYLYINIHLFIRLGNYTPRTLCAIAHRLTSFYIGRCDGVLTQNTMSVFLSHIYCNVLNYNNNNNNDNNNERCVYNNIIKEKSINLDFFYTINIQETYLYGTSCVSKTPRITADILLLSSP